MSDIEQITYPILSTSAIYKSFGGNHVLKGIDFTLNNGEVHALLGENGAGKSTLIKIISGALTADRGSLSVCGKTFESLTPTDAFELGIATIYQETSLYPALSVAENLFVGKRIKKGMFLDWKSMILCAEKIFNRLGVDVPVTARLKDLSKATAQLVEIARALSSNAKILIMDEPTASLSASETENLFKVIERLKADGASIIYISHRLEEVFRITDRITILRDGVVAGSVVTKDANHEWVFETMIGRNVERLNIRSESKPGGDLLVVERLSRAGVYEDVSFTVRRSEIVALAGLVGSGRSEVAHAIFGLEPADSGTVVVEGEVLPNKTSEVVRKGIAMVPEDRAKQGLILNMRADDNFTLSVLPTLSRIGVRNFTLEKQTVEGLSASLLLKPNDPHLMAMSFSGGNQQKIVIGKWLAINPRLLILDEPTCGVDIGAKLEFYRIMNDLAEQGIGILLISSDFEEIEHIADRILVMRRGRIVLELPGKTSSGEILKAATMSEENYNVQ